MRARTKLLSVAAIAAIASGTAAPAFADDFTPLGTATIKNVSDVFAGMAGPKHNIPVATVAFDYTCHGTVQSDHLFVAVKQGPMVQVGSSSADAVTFYSTNWHSDKGTNAMNCDGASHRLHAVLLPDPGFAAQHHPNPPLATGQSYLQICMFDSTGLTMNDSDAKVHAGSAS